MPGYIRAATPFEVKAPKGYNKIIIDPLPFNNSYLKDTIMVGVFSSVKDIGTVVIKKALHRIKVFAGDLSKSGGEFTIITSKLSGAKIKLETKDGNLIAEKLTNQQGFVEFLFENPETQYVITASGPDDKDFEIRQTTIYNVETKNWKNYTILLKPAARISGYVYVGTNNQPVANAHVWLNYSSTGLPVETFTNSSGYYTLRNVPKGKNEVKAAKKSSNFIGDKKNIFVNQNEVNNVNFNLKIYSKMDITHLLNFPIEVDFLYENTGVVKISGRFTDLESLGNNMFQAKNNYLSFSNIEIEPHPTITSVIFGNTVPVSKPKVLPLSTDENSLALKILTNYSGSLIDKNIGVELSSDNKDKGVIKGKVFVSQSSFSIPSTTFQFEDGGFYIKSPNSNDLRLPVITPDKSNPFAVNYFSVIKENGNKLNFNIYGYNADGDSTLSFINKDSVWLNTTIHTNIKGINPKDINLKIGNITITSDKVKPLNNQTTKISYALGEWNIELSKWSFDGYLSADAGVLKTKTIDIPITSLLLKPTEISNVSLDFSSMNLDGVVPLSVTGKPMFGYENSTNNWYLTVAKGNNQYAASFSGLPGMEASDSIFIASFSLYSDGVKNFSPQSKEIRIHKVGILTADQIIAGDNSVEMTSLTFKIPKVGQLGGAIQYYKENNKVKFKLLPIPIKFSTNGIDLAFGTDYSTYPEYFDENGLRVRGTISEEGKFNLIGWLYHTKDSTSIWVETPSTQLTLSDNWQTLKIGSVNTYLNKINGSMKPISNSEWNNFWFDGNLITPKGINQNQNKMKFTVYGEIKATGQELGVTNIPTSFGNMEWVYEFENKRLIGNMHFDKEIGGKLHVRGDANAMVDSEGWYFISGGQMNLNAPSVSGNACILFGDHSINDDIMDVVKSNSWIWQNKNRLPGKFPNKVSGFFFEGGMAIPIPILPEFDFDFGLVNAHLTHQIGGDIVMDMQFSGDGNSYGTGLALYGNIEAGLGASFVLLCGGVTAAVTADVLAQGYYYSDGNWFVDGDASVVLSGTTYAGFGICDSDCDGFCDKSNESASIGIGIKTHYGTDTKYIKLYLK